MAGLEKEEEQAQATALLLVFTATHLHIGSVKIPERSKGSRQSLSAVTNPQGLQMA
jgi:hypothetical protein